MNPIIDEVQVKRMEESISKIGAKVADVIEMSQQAKLLSTKSESLLIDVQQELEEFYVSMAGDDEKAE